MRACLVMAAMLLGGCSLLTGDGRGSLHQGAASDSGTPGGGEPPGITTLARSPNLPTAIAVSATHVYWMDTENTSGQGVLMRVPRAGGTPQELTPRIYVGAYTLAVNATHVYWATDAVFRLPLAGGTVEEVARTGSGASGLTIDATHAYWAGLVSENVGSVSKVPLAGGAVVIIAAGQACPRAIAADATNVYWTTTCEPGDELYPVLGKVLKAAHAGGEPVVLAENQPEPYALAVDGAHVYWVNGLPTNQTDHSSNPINRVAIAGGETVAIADDLAAVTLVADATHLYWSTVLWYGLAEPAGAVRRIPLAGGEVEDLATGQQSAWALALADTMVYWANAGDYTINSVPK